MKTTYNFFNGFLKFKFRLVFNEIIFIPLWIVLILIIWIGYLSFMPALLLSGIISLAISSGVAFFKIPAIDCYTINGRDYLLYNKYTYYEKVFDKNPPVNAKYILKDVYFIDKFLDDFAKNIELRTNFINDYFKTFKDINIDNLDHYFLNTYMSKRKSDILFAHKEICTIDMNADQSGIETLIPTFLTFKKIIRCDNDALKVKGMTPEQAALIYTFKGKMDYQNQKHAEIYNRAMGLDKD